MRLGDRIRKIREDKLKISKKELADILGISQSAVNQWEKGINFPSQKRLISLARVLDVSYEWLVSGFGDLDKKDDGSFELPFFEEISNATSLGFFNGESEAMMISSHLIPIPVDKLDKNIIALRIHGDSMEPAISDKGIVFVDISDTRIVDGKVYVYKQGDILRVKKFEYSVNGLIIKSFNSSYADERIGYKEFGKFWVVGRVLYSINEI